MKKKANRETCTWACVFLLHKYMRLDVSVWHTFCNGEFTSYRNYTNPKPHTKTRERVKESKKKTRARTHIEHSTAFEVSLTYFGIMSTDLIYLSCVHTICTNQQNNNWNTTAKTKKKFNWKTIKFIPFNWMRDSRSKLHEVQLWLGLCVALMNFSSSCSSFFLLRRSTATTTCHCSGLNQKSDRIEMIENQQEKNNIANSVSWWSIWCTERKPHRKL